MNCTCIGSTVIVPIIPDHAAHRVSLSLEAAPRPAGGGQGIRISLGAVTDIGKDEMDVACDEIYIITKQDRKDRREQRRRATDSE